MLYENWLHTSALNIQTSYCPPLNADIKTECLVIGGGFAGLHAALRLAEAGKQVVLLEKRICGGSSSGQSGGFLTPESEEDSEQLINSLGKEDAESVYNIPLTGVKSIVRNIKKYGFDCDLRQQDSLYFSTKKSHNHNILKEAETRKKMDLPYELLNEKALKKVHPGKGYLIALKYPGSYGINSFSYCQQMKETLLKKGARVFEDSEVHRMEDNKAITHLGSVSAKNIIICIDKMKFEFNEDISKKYYHMQTYLAISEPLSQQEMKALFPAGELMCWDTRLIYSHYRLISGNKIIIGGSSISATYYPKYYHSPHIIQSFIDELKEKFPTIKDVYFTHYWSGLIDVTKDLSPIADYDPRNKSIQYALGCAGLPWAAFCGDYLASRILDPKNTKDLSKFLGMHRKFFVPDFLQKVLGKKISFALSHLHSLYK